MSDKLKDSPSKLSYCHLFACEKGNTCLAKSNKAQTKENKRLTNIRKLNLVPHYF